MTAVDTEEEKYCQLERHFHWPIDEKMRKISFALQKISKTLEKTDVSEPDARNIEKNSLNILKFYLLFLLTIVYT